MRLTIVSSALTSTSVFQPYKFRVSKSYLFHQPLTVHHSQLTTYNLQLTTILIPGKKASGPAVPDTLVSDIKKIRSSQSKVQRKFFCTLYTLDYELTYAVE